MRFSIHTLELTTNPSSDKFYKLQDRAYQNSKGKHRVFSDGNKHIDLALSDKGIKVEYHDDIYKKKVKLIVNPTKLLKGNDIKELWKPKEENIVTVINKLEKHIEKYFSSKYKLDDFYLTRIDFTVNIYVGNRENVTAYIKVLHKLGKVKGYSQKYSDGDNIDKDLSFDLEGNSNGIEFTAYDKEGESKQKEAKGVLRVEVRLKKQKAIRKCTSETTTTKQIVDLAMNSRNHFLSIFVNIVPYGDFYKKKDISRIICDAVPKKNKREKMLKLVELIPKKKSLYLAQKEINDRNIDKIMTAFEKLNISPVPISKHHKVKHLKNLYSYFVDEE